MYFEHILHTLYVVYVMCFESDSTPHASLSLSTTLHTLFVVYVMYFEHILHTLYVVYATYFESDSTPRMSLSRIYGMRCK